MSSGRRPKPTAEFEIHLKGVYPEDVSVRMIADAVSALQGIAQGDQDGEPLAVHVFDIVRESAVYRCVSTQPKVVVPRLRVVGRLLARNETDTTLGNAFPFLRMLSEVAQQSKSEIEVRHTVGRERRVLATIRPDTYQRLKAAHTVSGNTVVFGELKRIGGATEPRCMVRAYKQRRAIFCTLDRKQARKLAERLYRRVVLEGEALWLRSTWDIVEFQVARIVPYRRRAFAETRERLRRAGAARWDQIPDSEVFFGRDHPGESG